MIEAKLISISGAVRRADDPETSFFAHAYNSKRSNDLRNRICGLFAVKKHPIHGLMAAEHPRGERSRHVISASK